MLHYCAAFDRVVYDPCLRPTMAGERDDFSGDMSRDFLAMMSAKELLRSALAERRGDHAAAASPLDAADGYW